MPCDSKHPPAGRALFAVRRRALMLAAGALVPVLAAGPAPAQGPAFPSRPVRIVLPFAPGGPTDLMARAISKHMSQTLEQPVIVENKPGGGGVIAMSDAANQPADGHTLVFPSILAVTNPALMANYPFDTLRDFTALTVVGFIPHALVVKPDYPARNLAELVARAKADPGGLAYGSSGNGTSAHLAGAMFAEHAGIRTTHVPYRGASPALQDLLGGQIHYMFLDMSSALAQIQAGKLRALAVAPARRFVGLPEVPTIAEQGYPAYDIHAWYGLLVRAGTPAPVVDRLYEAVRAALASSEVRETFTLRGIEPGGMPPREFEELIRSDLQMWKQTVDKLGIRLE
jgi:tripartite-type tricarboxylate transporter receptor subunit TctC